LGLSPGILAVRERKVKQTAQASERAVTQASDGSILGSAMVGGRAGLLIPFALLVAIASVSTASILIRFAQQEAPSLVIAALRLAFATVALAPIAVRRHGSQLCTLTRAQFLTGALSGICLAIHFATWISSLEYTTVASSVVLVSTGPLWVALLAPTLLKEKLPALAIVGLALALSGGAIIGLAASCQFRGGISCEDFPTMLRGPAFAGNALALVGAWAAAGYLIIGRRLRAKMDLVPYIFLVYAVAACGLVAIMLGAGETPFGYPAATYGWILLLAAVPQLIGHSTYNWALRYLPATAVAVTTLGEPVGSAVLAYFILNEIPTPAILAGGSLILCGIFLAARNPGTAGNRKGPYRNDGQ